MTSTEPDSLLSDVAATCWAMLREAARNPDLPTHLPVLATYAGELGLRTVVLRETDVNGRTLRCHTDRRSAKVSALLTSGHAQWLFYEPEERIQIRAGGPTRVHTDDNVATRLWHSARPSTRAGYRSLPAPGQIVAGAVERGETDGRENFAVIETRVAHMDYLQLGDDEHRRALFRWTGDELDVCWVAP